MLTIGSIRQTASVIGALRVLITLVIMIAICAPPAITARTKQRHLLTRARKERTLAAEPPPARAVRKERTTLTRRKRTAVMHVPRDITARTPE